ncbi:hypothetical protein V7S43_012962 [Phytophthora oleae]|uniref:RxLR effector protein n=1 Tax=Phytophthora oleae TaxID=2107226 RepID=A0ABD3F5P7_9STRA
MLQSFIRHQPSLLVSGLLAAAVVVAFYTSNAKRLSDKKESSEKPPFLSPTSPSDSILGHTLDMVRNADRFLDWLLELSESRDGEPFLLQLLGRSDLLIDAVPEHHEQILKT